MRADTRREDRVRPRGGDSCLHAKERAQVPTPWSQVSGFQYREKEMSVV